MSASHAAIGIPSEWVCRHAADLKPPARALDLACGSGRHARWLAARGLRVDAVDRNPQALQALAGEAGITTHEADIEEEPWSWNGERGGYDLVVVTNYLFRPHFDRLLDCVAPGGRLIYETFMLGNARFGKPSNPDFLLQPGELLGLIDPRFVIVAFEQGEVVQPKPAMVQRVCALRCDNAEPVWPRLD